ncbi:GNAT family N-acetyltransferase [Anaerosolibacter sp.]|uniref:GNAT family N-acetyltransferase n=1 Tax=Anaerosolibacter sp. TaxID=1872527 RepID=UPI0039EFEA90
MINFNPFPVLETKNLILRRMEHRDVHDVLEMRKDPRMHEYTDTKPDETPEETQVYIEKMNKGIDENKSIIWAIEHRQSKKVIGSISIWNINLEEGIGELGYGINPEYQGRGFMKEALLEVIDFGFNAMNLRALDAYTEENNLKSNKLLGSCKFTEIDRVDDQGYHSNRIYHMIVYRLKNNN